MKENNLIKKVGTQKLVASLALVALIVFFMIASDNFAQYSTIISILDSSYYVGFLAIGVTFVIVTGGIDLSCGSVMVCSALMAGTFMKIGLPVFVSMILCILFGGLFGVLNGFMVSVMKIPAFIATLGTMMMTRGLGSIVTKTASVTFPQRSDPDGWFRNIFKFMGPNTPNAGIPTGFILLIVLSIIMAIYLSKTQAGRYITALGSNKEATRLSGVNVVKYEMIPYIICGLFAGLAAISYGAIYSTFLPASGNGYELDAIAATVIGGTSLAGGKGSISGTLIGVFIMSVLKTGLPLVNLQPHYQLFFTGIVLVIAVFADVVTRNRKAK